MWRGRPALKLLTAKQVADQLQVKERTVGRLSIPVVRVGGLKRYRQEDVDAYVNLRIQYRGDYGKEKKEARRLLQGRSTNLGVSSLPTWAQLQKVRMGNAGRGEGGIN